MLRHAAEHGAHAVVATRYEASDAVEGVTDVLADGTAVMVKPLG
ncbi:heavy metal-binding domain-containing protein [Dyella halodurans]